MIGFPLKKWNRRNGRIDWDASQMVGECRVWASLFFRQYVCFQFRQELEIFKVAGVTAAVNHANGAEMGVKKTDQERGGSLIGL